MRGIDNKQVFVRYEGIYVRVNLCNLKLVNDPVKDHKGESVDNYTQDVENNYKQTQNKDTDMIIEVDKENVSNKLEEQKDKENKDMQVSKLADMISQLEPNDESVNPTKASGIAPTIKNKVTYKDPNSKELKKALVISRGCKASAKNE